VVAGWYNDSTGSSHGFLFANGVMTKVKFPLAIRPKPTARTITAMLSDRSSMHPAMDMASTLMARNITG